MQCQERKRINATEWIPHSASISVAGAVEIMQVDNEIASILTPDCVGIGCVRWSFMKTHWAAASARFPLTFANNPFGHKYVGCDAINVSVDADTMVQQLPHQLDDDQALNVNIKKNTMHTSTYLSGVVIKSGVKAWLQFLLGESLCNHYKITLHWDSFHANTITNSHTQLWLPTPSVMLRSSIYSVTDVHWSRRFCL
ncbi:helitron_like_N domain-containing protein [Trichonephila clavipes]|nr:helitron_like_N domain-containing protein [Trichonephila clavipes]